ncbi:AEC family transporter [Hoeflea sp. EC-HK425]|uniref:AEC family transporter n=1 Tax=Hoeflea sp. EC-HK425 TaxID=2038388 RepID=UPI00125B157D|nr:AEC family transporter [Hoeflea sp. EC-HK425]VVT21183.1 Permease [Hoeflea sp. EC-HK425]
MFDILSITVPIFIMIAIGYAAVHWRVFAPEAMRILGNYVVVLALPALLFKAISERPISEVVNWSYMAAYLCGSLLVLTAGYFYARRIQKAETTAAAFSAMGMVCSNTGFIGYPILLLTLPSIAGVGLALNMMVENIVLIPLLLAIAEAGHGGPSPVGKMLARTFRGLARNPIIIGLMAGLAASFSGLNIPAPLMKPIDMLAASSAAVSLLVIGGTLASVSVRGLSGEIAPTVAGKLVFHPLAVFAATAALPLAGLAPLSAEMQAAAVILAAVPMMGIYPILAQRFGRERSSVVAMLMATVLSFFTLSAVLWVVNAHIL